MVAPKPSPYALAVAQHNGNNGYNDHKGYNGHTSHSVQNGHVLAKYEQPQSPQSTVLSIVETWSRLVTRLKETTVTIRERHQKRAIIAKEIAARSDDWCNDIFEQQLKRLENLTSELEIQLAVTQSLSNAPNASSSPLFSFNLTPWQMEERYRALIQLQSLVGSFFERASPAYDQSRTLWWFDPSYHRSDGLNYDRYGAPDVKEYEARYLKALAIGDEKLPLKLLLTSSGVAAFTVINQFIMNKIAQAGDNIVISPYLYFECFDQLRPVNHVRIINATSFDAEEIIATAERHNAKAVYLDPMANTIGLETTDIRKFAQLLEGREGWANRYVVIDGTLISGGMPLYDWFNKPGYPKVIYYESAHKYIQMGMDIVMLGFIVYPEELHESLGLIRQVTGTTLYTRQANVLPQIDHTIHLSRMHWLTTNAEKLYHILDQQCSSIAGINFPTHWRKMGWSHGGNVVTIKLFGDGMNKRPSLDMFTDFVLRAAEEENVAMTKGGGLGFSVTRIWPSTPFIGDEDPYIRISVGVDPDEVVPVANAICRALDRHYRASKSAMARWRLQENGSANPNGAHFEVPLGNPKI